jgi:hypothetical protein
MVTFRSGPNSEWEKKSAALLRAFQQLPIIDFDPPPDTPPDKKAMPYRHSLGDIPRQLLLMRPIADVAVLPPAKVVAGKPVLRVAKREIMADKKALQDLAKVSFRTIKIMSGLSDNARSALNLKPEALKQFEFTLRILHHNAREAKAAPRLGAPKKTQAKEITDVVAQHFFYLTGREASDESFPKLLGKVFKILGVDARAASQAKLVGKKRKSN